jgi:tRNA threonylcarbamoyladenosine biosynthesis protein TsaE
MIITKSAEETMKIAHAVAQKIEHGGTVCLFGELGSGKTTFTKGLARYLGVEPSKVKSPTYTYIREFEDSKGRKIFHMDLYRVQEIDEILHEEIKEIAENKENILIIEWADRINGSTIKENSIQVFFEHISGNERKIIFK